MILLGLTGSIGSGCSHIAKQYMSQRGYEYISLGTVLRDLYQQRYPNGANPRRSDLQSFGNDLRTDRADYLAQEALKQIDSKPEQRKWVIDSIRNPAEVNALASHSGKFFLLAVFANSAVRWARCRDEYSSNQAEFEADDSRDACEGFPHGQRVQDCYRLADIIVSNDTDRNEALLNKKVNRYLDIIEGAAAFEPSETEAVMAAAHAASMQSKCLKRKVGAVILDNYGSMYSSGYNEVPMHLQPCITYWGQCYRDKLRSELSKDIENALVCMGVPQSKAQDFQHLFTGKFKILDHCRALHAEENAILSAARFGSSIAIRGGTLYTTTYPCNLCANKIVQFGIAKVVYSEPYPQKEAREVLTDNRVEQVPFEGVSFHGYFRFRTEVL